MHYDILCHLFRENKFGNKKEVKDKLKELGYTGEMVIDYNTNGNLITFRVYFGN